MHIVTVTFIHTSAEATIKDGDSNNYKYSRSITHNRGSIYTMTFTQ